MHVSSQESVKNSGKNLKFRIMRFHLKKTETGYMSSKNKYFTDAQKNAMKLRDELAQHQLAGTEPPVSLTVELKMAELLLKLESIETISVKYKFINKIWPIKD